MDNTHYNDWNLLFNTYLEHGRYTFTYEEISKQFSLSDTAISLQLLYYSRKKRIFQIRKGFYGIITPENSAGGILPFDLFIDSLMKHLNKPYYVSLLSAAALHGAAHQKPMVDFVISQTPAPRSIINKKMKLYFISKNSWEQSDIVQMKTRAGYINVSSPELTAFDLVVYSSKFGVNRVATVLQEIPFEVKNEWFAGVCNVTVYKIEELLGSKLKALYGRKKGRDLFDLYWALTNLEIDKDKLLYCNKLYYENEEQRQPTQKQFLRNMEEKLTDNEFTEDIFSVLKPEMEYNQLKAWELVKTELIEKLK